MSRLFAFFLLTQCVFAALMLPHIYGLFPVPRFLLSTTYMISLVAFFVWLIADEIAERGGKE